MPYVERKDGPTLYYELDDYTDPWKSAPTLLLQHGFGRSSQFWYSWIPYLSRYYRVVRPDLRGLGKSSTDFDPEKGIGLAQYLSDFNAIINHAGCESVHYCGESFGGLLGMAFAAEYPQRVRTLSLVSAPVYLNDHDKQSTAYGHESRMDALRKMGLRAWAEASNAGRRFPPDSDPAMLQWYVDERVRAASSIEVLVAMFNWVSGFSAVPFLPRIKAPVLGLYPSHNKIFDEEQLRALKSSLHDFRLVQIPSQYHAVQNFEPAACTSEVLHFAARYDGISCHE